VEVQPADATAARHRVLPDAGVHRSTLPLDVAWKSDIHRQQASHLSSSGLSERCNAAKHNEQARKVCVYALVILTVSLFAGRLVLERPSASRGAEHSPVTGGADGEIFTPCAGARALMRNTSLQIRARRNASATNTQARRKFVRTHSRRHAAAL